MNDWISVKDRMPEVDDPNGGNSDFVLMTNGQEISVGSFTAEYFIEDDPDRYEGQLETYSSPWWYCHGGIMEEPTHWMPLPSPPKEEA